MCNPINACCNSSALTVETKRTSSWKYPAYAAIAFYSAASSLFLIPPISRTYSHFKHQSLRNDIDKALQASLIQSLNIVLQGKDRGKKTATPIEASAKSWEQDVLKNCRGTDKEAGALAQEAFKLRTRIENLQKGNLGWDSPERLKQDLAALMNLPLYRRLENADCAAVNFLQYVAVKLIAADSNEALRDYGKLCLGPIGNQGFGVEELAKRMSDFLKNYGFSIDNGKAFYIASHPVRSMQSAQSVCDPLGCDASFGNPTFSAHCFELGDKKMIFYYGPAPTGNPLLEHGVLPAYRKFGVFELRFNHQDTHKRDDSLRIRETMRIAKENPDVLKHAVIGFDTTMDLAKFESADDFFDAYIPFVKDGLRELREIHVDNGLYIPRETLSDAQVSAALEKAREFCRTLSQNNPLWEEAMTQGASGRMRLGKVMKLVTDTCLALGMLYDSFDSITPQMVGRANDCTLDPDLTAVRTSGACKANIDRGLVENIALRLFFRWASDSSPLSEKEGYEIAGAIFGRARIVEDRKIMKKRFEILSDFLRFVGSAPRGSEQARKILSTYHSALSRFA